MHVLGDLDRLTAMASYDLFNADLADELREICRGEADDLRMPVTAVQAVLDTATAPLATNGGEGDFLAHTGGSPNEMALCPNVVAERAPFVREDLKQDPEHRDNPAVRAGLLRSYAGVPLVLPSGHVLGSFCVMGKEPHDFTDDEIAEMTRAADRVVETLRHYARPS